eukprot:CAMPEP_0173394934 /NCGR_PEP_ID=MMETSP1356-20130122/30089_1 /TAXON_ID=77927 ORGANISM="Hemiselmis virescens, Strain PCC157" /NCGR_SAMPLE_ID=MMETSP1356 /ASSEMBLY_ACC=CAM_ASM_000847 /LENGTH=39 /DNA_ID= /DNA_START= /DNA_END= /DNA_ORIENTATION=
MALARRILSREALLPLCAEEQRAEEKERLPQHDGGTVGA